MSKTYSEYLPKDDSDWIKHLSIIFNAIRHGGCDNSCGKHEVNETDRERAKIVFDHLSFDTLEELNSWLSYKLEKSKSSLENRVTKLEYTVNQLVREKIAEVNL